MVKGLSDGLLLCSLPVLLSGCLFGGSAFSQLPASMFVPPGAAVCTQVFDDKVELNPNRSLNISGDRCRITVKQSGEGLEEFVEFTFFDGTERVVGRVEPSNPKRINLVEISPPPNPPLPPSTPQISELFELAMRQYLVKRRVVEIYYFQFGKYKELPART